MLLMFDRGKNPCRVSYILCYLHDYVLFYDYTEATVLQKIVFTLVQTKEKFCMKFVVYLWIKQQISIYRMILSYIAVYKMED